MAKRDYGRDQPRRGEPTAPRNARDQFEGAGEYGGSYTAGGAAGAGFGGGFAGYDEARDEAPDAWRGYPRAETPNYAGRGPRGYRRSDSRINEDVCDALTADPFIDASDIEVRVADGEVMLSGTVESRAMKRRAEDVAYARGVIDVQNRLRIPRPLPDREVDRGRSVE